MNLFAVIINAVVVTLTKGIICVVTKRMYAVAAVRVQD